MTAPADASTNVVMSVIRNLFIVVSFHGAAEMQLARHSWSGVSSPPQLRRGGAKRRVVLINRLILLNSTTPASLCSALPSSTEEGSLLQIQFIHTFSTTTVWAFRRNV